MPIAIVTAILEFVLDVFRLAVGMLGDDLLSFVRFLAGAASYVGHFIVASIWFFTLFLLFKSFRFLAASPLPQLPSIRSVILSVGSWIWSFLAPVVFFLLALVVREYYSALNRLNGRLGIFVDDWNVQPRLRGRVRTEFEALTRRQKTLRDEICDLNRRITGCLYRYSRIAAKLQGIGELARRDCVKLSVCPSARLHGFVEVRPSDLVGNSVQFLNLPGPWVRLIFRIDYVVWNLQASLTELQPFVRENEDKVTKLREELEKLTKREAAEDEILRLAESEYRDATRTARVPRLDGLTHFNKIVLKKTMQVSPFRVQSAMLTSFSESVKSESWWHRAHSRVHRGAGSSPTQQRDRRGGLARPRVPTPVGLPTQVPLLPAQESQLAVQEAQNLAQPQQAVDLHQEPQKRSTVHFDEEPHVVVYEPLKEVSSMMLPLTDVKQPEAVVSVPTPTTPFNTESYLSRFVVPFEDFSRFLARQEEANWVQEMKNCFKFPAGPILYLPLQVEYSDVMDDDQPMDDLILVEQPIREEEHAEPSQDLVLVDHPYEQDDPMDVDEQTTDPVFEQPSMPVQLVQSGPTDAWQAARPVTQTNGQAPLDFEGELALFEAELMDDMDRDMEFENQPAQEVAPAAAELPAIRQPVDVYPELVLNQVSEPAPSGQDATPWMDEEGVGQLLMMSDDRPNESDEWQVMTQPASVTALAGLMQTVQPNQPTVGRQSPQQALESPPRMTAQRAEPTEPVPPQPATPLTTVLTQPSLPLPPSPPVPGQLVLPWPNSDSVPAQLDAPQPTTSTPSTRAKQEQPRPRTSIPTPEQILMPPPPKPTTPKSKPTTPAKQVYSCLRPNSRGRKKPENQKPPSTPKTPATPTPVKPTPKAAETSKPTEPARPAERAVPKHAEEAKLTEPAKTPKTAQPTTQAPPQPAKMPKTAQPTTQAPPQPAFTLPPMTPSYQAPAKINRKDRRPASLRGSRKVYTGPPAATSDASQMSNNIWGAPANQPAPDASKNEGMESVGFALPIPEKMYPPLATKPSFVAYTGTQVYDIVESQLVNHAERYLKRRVDENIVKEWMVKLIMSVRAELVEGGKSLTHEQACNYIDDCLIRSARDPMLVGIERGNPINQRSFVNAVRYSWTETGMGVRVDPLPLDDNGGMLDP